MMVRARMSGVNIDTDGLADEDEPLIDVCYISDMLVNMIAGDTQQFGFSGMEFALI
jgi:hypothetical protein